MRRANRFLLRCCRRKAEIPSLPRSPPLCARALIVSHRGRVCTWSNETEPQTLPRGFGRDSLKNRRAAMRLFLRASGACLSAAQLVQARDQRSSRRCRGRGSFVTGLKSRTCAHGLSGEGACHCVVPGPFARTRCRVGPRCLTLRVDASRGQEVRGEHSPAGRQLRLRLSGRSGCGLDDEAAIRRVLHGHEVERVMWTGRHRCAIRPPADRHPPHAPPGNELAAPRVRGAPRQRSRRTGCRDKRMSPPSRPNDLWRANTPCACKCRRTRRDDCLHSRRSPSSPRHRIRASGPL